MPIVVPADPRRRYAKLCAGLALAFALVAAPGSAQAAPVTLAIEMNPAPVERPTDGTALVPLYLSITLEKGWEIASYEFEKAYNDQGQTLGFSDNPGFEFDLLIAEWNPGWTIMTPPGAYQVAADSPYGDFDRNSPDGSQPRLPRFIMTVTRSTPGGPQFFTAEASYSFTVLGPVTILPEPASIASAAVAACVIGTFGLYRRRRGRAPR